MLWEGFVVKEMMIIFIKLLGFFYALNSIVLDELGRICYIKIVE